MIIWNKPVKDNQKKILGIKNKVKADILPHMISQTFDPWHPALFERQSYLFWKHIGLILTFFSRATVLTINKNGKNQCVYLMLKYFDILSYWTSCLGLKNLTCLRYEKLKHFTTTWVSLITTGLTLWDKMGWDLWQM